MDKERKEMEKKSKKDEEKQRVASQKATKRLSKRPPAAMETQRMPAALSRPSASSTSRSASPSQDVSRQTSKEDRRSSFTSLSSLKRFSRTSSNSSASSQAPSPPSWKRISDTVPQLGKLVGIESHSRKGSASTQGSKHSDGDEAYVSDIVSFAYQLEASQEAPYGVSMKGINTARFSLPSAKPLSSGTSAAKRIDGKSPRGRNSPQKHGVIHTSPEETTQQTIVVTSSKKKDEVKPSYHYPPFVRPRVDEAARKREIQAAVARDLEKFRRSPPTPPHSSFPSITSFVSRPSQDGSSYVHKQRMYQQRRSISGYQDEMAVKDAIDPARQNAVSSRGKTNMPPTPNASSESFSDDRKAVRNKQNDVSIFEPLSSEDDTTDGYHRYLAEESQKSSGKTTKRERRNSKAERMLGERSKSPDKSTSANPARKLDQAPTIPNTIPSWTPLTVDVTPNSSIADDENKPNLPKNVAIQPTSNKEEKSNNPPRDHSRSRTTSSQILTQDIRPLGFPRSSTSPALKTAENLRPNVPVPPTEPPSVKQTESTEREKPSASSADSTDQSKSAPPEQVKTSPEVVVEGVDGDGLVRRTSIKRPRSDPNLLISANNEPLPSLDFLPQLKHQPLTKPKRMSPAKVTFAPIPESAVVTSPLSQSPRPSSALSLSAPTTPATIQSKPSPSFASAAARRLSPTSSPSKRTSMLSPPSTPFTMNSKDGNSANDAALATKPLAKMFVICCKCKFWHDLPSKLYEAMALPRTITTGDGVAQSVGAKNGFGSIGKGKGIAGKVFTEVRCPWCEHGMSTVCCAGWTAIVYLHQRHH